MPIPVLIAAHNEAEHLSRTLDRLPEFGVSPIVLANACSDNTAEIARTYGVKVLELEQKSKLRALQEGIRLAYKDMLRGPFLTLDGDSAPLFPSLWHEIMLRERLRRLPMNRPAFVTGGLVFFGGPGLVSNAIRSAKRTASQYKVRDSNQSGFFYGANALVDPRTREVIDDLLAMDDIWPGEDEAMKDIILEHGGGSRKVTDPRAVVLTDAERYPSIWHHIRHGRNAVVSHFYQSYSQDHPTGHNYFFRKKEQNQR